MITQTQVVFVPVRTVSETNRRDHWAAKARRVRNQRVVTGAYVRQMSRPKPPCAVRMVRCELRTLDDDNLRAALKGPRDEIAAWLGIDDGDEARVRFEYAQEPIGPRAKNAPAKTRGVRIEVRAC